MGRSSLLLHSSGWNKSAGHPRFRKSGKTDSTSLWKELQSHVAKSIDIDRGGKLAHFYKYLHTSFKRDFEGIRCSPMWLTYSWSFKKGQFCGFEGQRWNLFAGAWEKRDIRENVQDTGWKQGRRWQKILNSDFSPMDSSSEVVQHCSLVRLPP